MQNQKSVSVNWNWISQAWKLYTDNVGVWIIMMIIYIVLYLGLSFVVSAIAMAVMFASIDPSSPNFDPATSMWKAQLVNLLSLIIIIPFATFFITGFFKTAIKQAMGGQISVGDLFSGGDRFLAMLKFMLLIYLIMFAIYAVILIPTYFIDANIVINLGNLGISSASTSPSEAMSALGPLLILMLITMIAFIFIFSGMFYAIPGIIHSQWGVIEGIRNSYRLVGSKILMYVLFTIVAMLLSMSGAFLCFIGLLITAPFYVTIPAVAYREVVGGETETMPLPPPPPDHWMNNQ